MLKPLQGNYNKIYSEKTGLDSLICKALQSELICNWIVWIVKWIADQSGEGGALVAKRS